MTKNMDLPLFTTNQVLNHKPLSPKLQQEQAIKLQPFYGRLISLAFSDSSTAIEHCRDLCAEYGFTVKQEASTHRNIYIYCSREGIADSLRNPKSNPQRRRPSKRCDCRWRVVLFETNGHWEFRKSLNPEASKHNHELMNPNDIERSWPKEVTQLIFTLARQRLTTQEVRIRVQTQFPYIHWNERRFYNRLSEERQKVKLRDSVVRTRQLNGIWSRLCMVAAGNDDLSKIVEQQLNTLFQSVCETVQVDPQLLPEPTINNNNDNTLNFDLRTLNVPNRKQLKPENPHKGYLSVEVPSQIYHVKIHSQRQLQETHILQNQKRQRTFSEESMLELPNCYPKIKSRQSSPSSCCSDIKSPNTYSMSATTVDYNSISSQSLAQSLPVETSVPQQQPQNSFVYGYDSQLTLNSLQSYIPSFPVNTPSAAAAATTSFSIATTPTDTTSSSTTTSTTSNNDEFNTQSIPFTFNTSPSLVGNARSSSVSSPPYSGLDTVMKSRTSNSSSSPSQNTNGLSQPLDAFYTSSLQNKTDNSLSSLQLPVSAMTQSYTTSPNLVKSPMVSNESYQRQMMSISPVTSRPF